MPRAPPRAVGQLTVVVPHEAQPGTGQVRDVNSYTLSALVQASGGELLTVSEVEIVESLRSVSRQGYYIEPTSAAVTAGVTQYLRQAPRDERIVTVFTGHGLKATEKMMKLAH